MARTGQGWSCVDIANDSVAVLTMTMHSNDMSGTRGNSVCDAVGHENDDDDTVDYMDMDNG